MGFPIARPSASKPIRFPSTELPAACAPWIRTPADPLLPIVLRSATVVPPTITEPTSPDVPSSHTPTPLPRGAPESSVPRKFPEIVARAGWPTGRAAPADRTMTPAVVSPIVFPETTTPEIAAAVPSTRTPTTVARAGTVPARPMTFDRTWTPVAPAILTPAVDASSMAFPSTTVAAPAPTPDTSIPIGFPAPPAPMRLSCTTFPVAPAPVIRTPATVLKPIVLAPSTPT